ncbi:MAG TPA: glycosyltransferase [Planctomycetes bacterium]|nr:glycosyltransferase [Planctomycetota bacterium]
MRLSRKDPGLDIVFLCHGWYPDVGGVESHTRDLARELSRRGHRVRALALDYSEREPYSISTVTVDDVEVSRMAYRYHDHHGLADLVDNEKASEVAAEWIASVPCDIVHAHHVTGFSSRVLMKIAERGIPLTMTLHDYWSLCPRGQMLDVDGAVTRTPEGVACARCLARTWPHLMPSSGGSKRAPGGGEVQTDEEAAQARTDFAIRCLASPQRLFTPSEAARQVYVDAGVPAERIEVVPNGIDVDELAAEVARMRAIHVSDETSDEIRLGLLGTLLPSKGCLEFIRAFQEANVPDLILDVHGNMPSYHGDSSYLDAVREIAKEDPRIRIHGPYDHERLGEILAHLDGVVAPSRWCEVFGLTVREARAAGLPVLVSAAGDLGSVAAGGQAGVVVDVDDHAGWVEALRAFADYRNRARWRRHTTRPRTAFDMMLQLEKAYVDTIESMGREVPELSHTPGVGEAPKSMPDIDAV